MESFKDWLGFENNRNKRNAALYERLIKRAIGAEHVAVLIGHHLTFEINGDLSTENEVPSADCLMFDHFLMGRVFGKHALNIMRNLASVDCEARDTMLDGYLRMAEAGVYENA
jgi:hypothetical protein